MGDGRARNLILRACAAFLALILPLSGVWAAAGEGTARPDFDAPDYIITTRAAGDSLSAENVVLNGITGNVKSLCTFANADGRLLISTADKTGYGYVRTGDGSRASGWIITGTVGSICALARIGYTHHAAVKVMARQSSWPDSRPDEEKILWINAYNSYVPAIVPAYTQRRIAEHGAIVAFETGIPGADVELWLRDGEEAVTTAAADETGFVIFDADHAADGKDHYVSVTYTFGYYDYHAATAYASDPANLTPAGGGTGREWVSNNDCATFVSRILTAGGFPIYAPYTNSSSSQGGSVRHTLVSLTDGAYFKNEFTIEDFHEGDIVWGHDMGHTLYCSAVNPEENTIHVYAHSTRANSPLCDNGWVSIDDLNAVMQMVTEEVVDCEYRIDGVADPRQIVLESEPGGQRETPIVQSGSTFALPECPFPAPNHALFLGWLVNDTLVQPGEELTVDGHMTITAQWRDTIVLGEADLVLPASVSHIEAGAFEGLTVESVYLPDGCAVIGAGAFKDCQNLRRIRIPQGCAMDETAFDGCGGVTVYGAPDSPAERFCQAREGFLFKPE